MIEFTTKTRRTRSLRDWENWICRDPRILNENESLLETTHEPVSADWPMETPFIRRVVGELIADVLIDSKDSECFSMKRFNKKHGRAGGRK